MLRISTITACASAILFAASLAPRLFADPITTDTYIDSYAGGVFPPVFLPVVENNDYNYGNFGAVKVVVSNGSTDFPGPSVVHTVFTLPQSFWNAIGNSKVASASVTFAIRNNNNGTNIDPNAESVLLAPLTQAFTAGTGGTPGQTKGSGAKNTPAAPFGADWFTYDGVNPWTTPGGTFDPNDTVSAIDTNSTTTSLTWDITNLINDTNTSQDTRADIQNFGLLLKFSDDALVLPVNTQDFISFYSSEGAAISSSPTANAPVINFTLTPEPASLGIIALGAVGLLARRKQKDA